MRKSNSAKTNGKHPASAGTGVGTVESLEGTRHSEEAIAERAYQRWLARGCPSGSPEEDWFEAERELRVHSGSA